MSVPVLPHILRQHAEQAAFLWTVYDRALLSPADHPEMDAAALADLVERLEAHLDGLRIAGAEGMKVAQALYAEYPEPGELFVVRMMTAGAPIAVADLDLHRVRAYLADQLGTPSG
ncbi:MAG: hypothetical protein KBF78_16190 [Fuscovulum sp.]|jgi:hypothetical protein|nr:hypothetical protein [Fuscovulum sp.]